MRPGVLLVMLWVICGAGRGVGKTHLAQRLCEVLPNSVYAKCGHGQRQPGKPANFFNNDEDLAVFIQQCAGTYDHIVAESNGRARRGEGDVIIFVEGTHCQTDVRSDADLLRTRAHLRVGASASARDWRRVLRRKLPNGDLREAVCEVLTEQKHYLGGWELAARTKVWLEVDGMHAFGSGLAQLLEGVARTGTLQEAAQAAHISYRHAWDMIKRAEKRLGKELILPQRGGLGGGRSTLAADGQHLLEVFKRLNREVAEFAESRFVACQQEESPDE